MINITAMLFGLLLFGLLLDKLFAISGDDSIAMIKQMNEHDIFFNDEVKWIIGSIFLF